MLGYFSLWMSFSLLFPFLLAAGAVECSEKETLINPKPSTMKKPTDCLIECSLVTYEKKLQLQDNHKIQMSDSTEGKNGGFAKFSFYFMLKLQFSILNLCFSAF